MNTPMHYAAQFGRLEIVKYLSLKGGELDRYRNLLGYRPIHLACLCGHLDVVRYLVENGVPLSDDKEIHPIHCACMGGYVSIIEYLISQNVDLNAKFRLQTPLCYAANYGSLAAVKLLVKHNVSCQNKGRRNKPLLKAVKSGHLDVVRFFIEQGCDPNVYTLSGRSALITAAEKKDLAMVKYLLSHGAKIFDDSQSQNNPDESFPRKKRKNKKNLDFDLENADPILYLYLTEEILLLFLRNIDLDAYINGGTNSDEDNYINRERYNKLINAVVDHQSVKILDFLIEHKILKKDCTDLYCLALDMEKPHLVITFLEKGLAFDPDSPLVIESIAKSAYSTLMAKLRKYGFIPSQDSMYLLTCHAIAYHNFDVIQFLLESKFIVPNQKYSTQVPDNFEGRSFINYLLSCSVTGQIRYSLTCTFNKVYKTELTKILKLFLDYGFTFSVDPPIVLSPFVCNEHCKHFLRYLKMIDEAYPSSIDFSNYPIMSIEKLLFTFHTKFAQEILDFYLKHNFSFRSRDGTPQYDDLLLFYKALLGELLEIESESIYDTSFNNHPIPDDDLTDDELAYRTEQKSKGAPGQKYRDPDFKFIYYLFDHDYIISPQALHAVVRVGIKTNNNELIHKAFQHCALSNRNIAGDWFRPFKTPLEIACKNGLADIAIELVNRGADVNESGGGNGSPLLFAQQSKNQKLIDFLLSKQAQLPEGDSQTYKYPPPSHSTIKTWSSYVKFMVRFFRVIYPKKHLNVSDS